MAALMVFTEDIKAVPLDINLWRIAMVVLKTDLM